MDHPAIANALRTGYPHGEPTCPHCPVCGAETDIFYKDRYFDIVGCVDCMTQVNAWEEMEDEYEF